MTERAPTTSASGSAASGCLADVPNPFARGVVRSVWEKDVVDVEAIHREAFSALLGLVEERRRGVHGRSVLLYGFAGSGKTHLLRRLRLHLQSSSDAFVPFIWVWMQTSPGMKWRHLRREFINNLLRGQIDGRNQLEQLIELAAGEFEARLERLVDRNLQVVLEHLAKKCFVRDATAWLRGDPLPESVAERLGLGEMEFEDASAEDASRRLIHDLASFSQPTLFVLCLDQLEQLQAHPGDRTGLFAVGELFAALDRIENAIVIGCAQTEMQEELDGVLMQYARDRFRPLGLGELKPAEIEQLVRARLAAEPRIAACRPAGASEFWPIDLKRLRPAGDPIRLATPRWVLYACAEQFEAARGKALPRPSLGEFLRLEYQARLEAAQQQLSPNVSDGILSDGLPRLLHLGGYRIIREELPPWLDHELVSAEGAKIGVAISNETPRGRWRKLNRILEGWRPEERSLVILTDAFHPVSTTAKRTRELLEELERRGARRLIPSKEALAALDALRRLLGDVESGDQDFEGGTPELAAVEAWVRRNTPPALAQLLEEITRVVRPGQLCSALADLLAEEKVLSATRAAEALGADLEELVRCARENRHHFGLLMGAEPVVFEKTPTGAGA